MSFWNNLFGSDKTKPVNNDLLENISPEPGILLPRAIVNHWDAIKKTARNTVVIHATPDSNLTLRQSKFGHYPCIPRNFKYPIDRNGKYMYPLAQINFSEVPRLVGFPDSGYLQFYISGEDCYGLSFEVNIPSDFKVLFFEENEVIDIEEDFSFLDNVLSESNVPLHCSHSLKFELKKEYIGLEDFNYDRNSDFNIKDLLEQYKSIEGELEKVIYDKFQSDGHKLGGYAFFTQGDPRNYKSAIQDFQLLFQMDSGDEIMWGDMGVGNFFIHPENLSKKDFSEVFYTWDCC